VVVGILRVGVVVDVMQGERLVSCVLEDVGMLLVVRAGDAISVVVGPNNTAEVAVED
jgi:hypothetical protein